MREPAESNPRFEPLRWAAHAIIRGYQLTLSSLLGRHCRYLPTCSEYADEAIRRHGLWAGGWIGLSRLCRCHPFASAGFDPVPPTLPPDASWHRPWRFGRWREKFECTALPAERRPAQSKDFV
jgi:putative membrane protein insertion efficiency factor